MSGALVLCYHAVSERWPAALSVTPERLRAQLEHLTDRGWHGVPFSEVALGHAGRGTFAVTFDDAYRSVFTQARPILEEAGVPGSVFAPTSWVGIERPMTWRGIEQWLGTEYQAELLCMTWAELRELAEAGWEVGSHTRTHPHLTSLDDGALALELEGSRQEFEQEMEEPCASIAYPYGDWDERVAAAAGAAGYQAACTLPARLHAEQRLAWPRVGIYHADDRRRFRLKASPLVRRFRSTGVWGLVRRSG